MRGWRSRGVGAHGPERLVAGLKAESFLDFVVEPLGVLEDVSVALDAGVTDDADDLDTVVDAVAAADHVQGAGKEAVLGSLDTVLAGLAGVSQLEVDADGRAEGPPAGVAVEVGQSTGLAAVPLIDA